MSCFRLLLAILIFSVVGTAQETCLEDLSLRVAKNEYEELERSIIFSAAPTDIFDGEVIAKNHSNNNNKLNCFKTGIDIQDIIVKPSTNMSTNHAPNMTDDQITNMLIGDNGQPVMMTSDMLRGFDVTPRLCAKLLFALCKTVHGSNKPLEEMDALANICREFLPSASPLTDIIRCLDSQDFLPFNDRVVSFKSAGKGFSRFLHFCLSLCNTDKQVGLMSLYNHCNINLPILFSNDRESLY